MRQPKRSLGTGLLLVLMAGLVGGTAQPLPVYPASPSAVLTSVPPAVSEAVQAAEANQDAVIDMELQAAGPADVAAVEQAVTKAGGQVINVERTVVRAKVPVAAAETLPTAAPVIAVGMDQKVALDTQRVAPATAQPDQTSVGSLMSVSMSAMGIEDFRRRLGVAGRGVTVAVIDSGIDVGHPDLRETADGQPKVIDWKDFTDEGSVDTTLRVSPGDAFAAPGGRRYTLPPMRGEGRFGYWDESGVPGPMNQDLDQNGMKTDRFGVLLVDATGVGRFDTVYVDTNNDGDFTDEQPLQLFASSQAVGKLGKFREGRLSVSRLNFVVADIDRNGKWVKLGFDALGHGTQVSGVLAANGAAAVGVAPGAQLMALKAVNSDGNGSWYAIKEAIRYAASHGASVINVSIGGLAASAARTDSTASEWLNQTARDSGALIVLASDNTGPGLSSGTTLGSPSEVMAAGAYYSPEMWKRDFGYVVPHESIWSLSGMGPRSDGSYLPSVVAPGGSPTTSPYWLDPTGYATKVGTSIATPHISGAAALLIEAGRENGIQYDRLSVKRALELGARRISGFGVYEQGYGLVTMAAAYNQLRSINSIPALKARSSDGNGGLLARSYRPGSSSFWLTNLDPDLTRVGIYSSEDWVRPSYTSLTLPPSVARQLPVMVSPPSDMGVHSAFLLVTDQNKYGPSLTIPVTHVSPVEVGPAGYKASDTIEAARYKRYFINVKPDTGTLSVTVRMGDQQGTAQVHVFRPDGRAVQMSQIGFNGTGLASTFQAEDPIQGVWEIVVTAMPDTRADHPMVAYSLDVQTNPGMVSGQPVRITVPAGQTITRPLKVTNVFAPFVGQVEVAGLVRQDPANPASAGIPWRVERKLRNVAEEFTLQGTTHAMRLEIDNPVPANVDLDLYLWYYDPVLGWKMRAWSTTKNTSHEVIDVANLPAGTYQAFVAANGPEPASLQYQYRRLLAVDGTTFSVVDTARRHEAGDTWTVNLTVNAPDKPGRYTGQVLLRDTEHQTILGWVPVEVSVGEPVLSVQPLVSQLVQGQPGDVVLELRDPGTGRLVPDATVTVNGQRFQSRSGQISVPVTAQGPNVTLNIEADVPGYQFVNKQIIVPAKDHWSMYPLGTDQTEENTIWRRKLTTELP